MLSSSAPFPTQKRTGRELFTPTRSLQTRTQDVVMTQGVLMFPVCSSSQTHTSIGVSVCASVRSDRCTDGRPPSAVSPAVRQEACLPHGRGAAAGERLGSGEAAQLRRAASSPLQLLAGKISSQLTLTDALPPRFRRVQQPRGNEPGAASRHVLRFEVDP